ncbi:hypothetical protein QCA50_007109 [Cerrena zonata]|uniref:Uncharacterized protein n=1 Tax=Cerrena zonata TaxID=2478898 RepID=A0AAW0G6M7_9APHY
MNSQYSEDKRIVSRSKHLRLRGNILYLEDGYRLLVIHKVLEHRHPNLEASKSAISPIISPSASQDQTNAPAPSYDHSLEKGNPVHSMLVDQMGVFEDQLEVQINNATYSCLTPPGSHFSVHSPGVPRPAVTHASAIDPVVTSAELSQPSGLVQGWASSTSQDSQASSPFVYQVPSTGYQYVEPSQQPPITSETSSLKYWTSQPTLFPSMQPASQPQPQSYAYDILTYNYNPQSQDLMQYQGYPVPPPAQGYDYYHSHPTEATRHRGTASVHPGGNTSMYPPKDSSYEVENADSATAPQHHQYPTPLISSCGIQVSRLGHCVWG